MTPTPAARQEAEQLWLIEAKQFAKLSTQENGLKVIEKETLAHHLRRMVKEYDTLTRLTQAARDAERERTLKEAAEVARQRIGNCATNDPIEAGKNIVAAEISNTISKMRRTPPREAGTGGRDA